MTFKENFRYERKFILDKKISNLNIESMLINSKFIFSKHFEDRKVNSIYFENRNLNSISENLDGLNLKKKIRLRWYGDEKYIENPSLEIKFKKGHLNNKKIFKIKNFNQIFSRLNLEKLNHSIKKSFSFLNNYSIISSTHYKRKYYISFNKLIRATVDNDVFYKKLSTSSNFEKIRGDSNKILEIKYKSEYDNYFRSSINNIKLRISKNSKFINSIIK